MKRKTIKRLAAVALSLALLLSLAACGGQASSAQEEQASAITSAQEASSVTSGASSETLKGIYEALISPDSIYNQNNALNLEYYPELEYSEALESDRITLSFKANGNEYFSDGSWDFILDGDRLTTVISDEDYTGIFNVLNVGSAIGDYFGLDSDLVRGYLNGLGTLGIESGNFTMTEDASAGTTMYSFDISGPWDMKELDQMVLDESFMDNEPLDDDYISQSGSVGKIRMMANGNVSSYTMLFAEYGNLTDIAYQSIVNMVSMRQPAGWEAFLADFTELKDLETEDYMVDLDPDDETIMEIMGEKNDKFRYALVRFGPEEAYSEEEIEIYVPDAEAFADFYFRVVADIPQGTAGSSLAAAQTACDVLAFATGNELWLADVDTLRANMLEAWESLTDDERANFDQNFPNLNDLLYGCFEDWEENRGRFEDAGVAESMDELMEDETAQWSWDTLSAHTWTLGNDG